MFVAIAWARALDSQHRGSLFGWNCSRTIGMSERKKVKKSWIQIFSLLQICFRGAASSPCALCSLCFSSQANSQ